MIGILVCSECYNKRLGGLKTAEGLKSGQYKIKVPADSVSMEGLFHGSGWPGHLLTVTSHCGRGKVALWDMFYKSINFINEAIHLLSNHLPKTPILNIIILGISFQYINFGVHI